MSKDSLERIMRFLEPLTSFSSLLVDAILTTPPFGLGYPSETSQSNYYLGTHVTREEIANVSRVLEKAGIEPENTRIRKHVAGDREIFDVLQAAAKSSKENITQSTEWNINVRLVRGDHAAEMAAICIQ
jgi:dipeptidyl-peptidase-3